MTPHSTGYTLGYYALAFLVPFVIVGGIAKLCGAQKPWKIGAVTAGVIILLGVVSTYLLVEMNAR